MPSSTSSSNDRLPRCPWLKAWVCTAIFAGIMLGALEYHWRAIGHHPSVVDDEELWSVERKRAESGSPTAVVLLGASRLQVAFVPEVFEKAYPNYQVANLTIDGKGPIAALRDLANDAYFRGIVICDLTEPFFNRDTWDQQQGHVQHYHELSWPHTRFERVVQAQLEKRVVALRPELNLRDTVLWAYQLMWRKPYNLVTYPDRHRKADYQHIGIDELRRTREKMAEQDVEEILKTDPEVYRTAWLDDLKRIGTLVERIEERGGKVVFLRMPTTGRYGELYAQVFPRDQYWDHISALTLGQTIHFQDVPSLANLHCPEGSHIDYRDSPKFTLGLAEELERRGLIHRDALTALKQ